MALDSIMKSGASPVVWRRRTFPLVLAFALLSAGISAMAQEMRDLQVSQIPEELREELMNDYFEDNSIISILWERYQVGVILVLSLLALSVIGIRNYARNLARQEARLFDTFQSNAILIFDRVARARMLNRAARQLLGLDDFVPMEEEYTFYLKNAPTAEIRSILEEVRRSHQPTEREVIFNAAKMMKTIVVKCYPLFTESRRLDGFVLMIADITEAIEQDRRVNWSGVAQHVAHKAKTPLSTITLTAQHLEMVLSEMEIQPSPEVGKFLDRIVNESRKLNEIVHNLTRLANKEQLNLLPNDVNMLLQSIADDYRGKVSRNVEIRTALHRTLPRVGIDIAHFPECVQNLLDNAVRAIGPRDGRIIITTALGQWIDRPGEYVEITISDTGVGMDDDVKKSIFRPFSTHSHGGTGLGLVIVQKIVQEHNGEISFNSTPGIGTTFQIRLPVITF